MLAVKQTHISPLAKQKLNSCISANKIPAEKNKIILEVQWELRAEIFFVIYLQMNTLFPTTDSKLVHRSLVDSLPELCW